MNTAIKLHSDKPLLIINEDNDHYFKFASSLMTREKLENYVDDITAGGHVTHIFFCAYGQRPSYASEVCEPIWAGMEDIDHYDKPHNIWCINTKLLYDNGIDPYHVWIKRTRERGVSPWVSMRMNDLHFITKENYFRTCNFWREHPELRRKPTAENPSWADYALDYSKEPVREYHFRVFKELVDRYEPDGIELDWMRFQWHLTPGQEREQAHFITDFIRRCREYACEASRRCGHGISLSVRVPVLMEVAHALGFEPEKWAADGLVDLIVATNFYGSNDYDIPIDQWMEKIGQVSNNVIVLPGATDKIRSYYENPQRSMGTEYFNAWGNLLYAKGAKGLYLFNAGYLPPAEREAIYKRGMAPETLISVRRRFPITYHDSNSDMLKPEFQLPCSTAELNELKINLADVCSDSTVTLILGFSEKVACCDINAALNGNPPMGDVVEVADPGQFGVKYAAAASFPAAAALNGTNILTIGKTGTTPVQLEWCEIILD